MGLESLSETSTLYQRSELSLKVCESRGGRGLTEMQILIQQIRDGA